MAESFAAQTLPAAKAERYDALLAEVDSVLEGEVNLVARMASVASMLASAFETFLWTGFYVVDPAAERQLVVGPYQGSLGCLRIVFGKGVCGEVAATLKALVVPDVNAYPGHIACDSRSRSEIVVPVLGAHGELIAVLDVDSADLAAFDEIDRAGLEAIAGRVAVA